jgi:WD40 repeat protein
VTCLAISTQPSSPRTLFAGCWDKKIYSWNADTRRPSKTYIGHSDFIKCVLYLPLSCSTAHPEGLFLSGSADATIVVWDIATGAKLHKLKGHARGVQDLALDSSLLGETVDDDERSYVPEGEVMVWSAGSEREIRRWHIALDGSKAYEAPEEPLLIHETSVYRLLLKDSTVWTASADNTAKLLVKDNEDKWSEDLVLKHPDFVRDVITVRTEGGRSLVATACRDEEVRVWDADVRYVPTAFTHGISMASLTSSRLAISFIHSLATTKRSQASPVSDSFS